MAGVRAGDDRRVVRERDGRQRRHRAVAERDAHLDEARDVRRLAARAHVVEHVRSSCRRTGTPTTWLRTLAPGRARRASGSPSWHRDVACRRARRRAAEERGDRGCGVDEAGRAGITPSDFTPLPPITIGARACTIPMRAVLAEVAALVLPVVRGGVDHAQVGRGGRVEELGGLRRTRTGRRSSSRCGMEVRALGRRAPTNLSVDWSASGLRPVVARPRRSRRRRCARR